LENNKSELENTDKMGNAGQSVITLFQGKRDLMVYTFLALNKVNT